MNLKLSQTIKDVFDNPKTKILTELKYIVQLLFNRITVVTQKSRGLYRIKRYDSRKFKKNRSKNINITFPYHTKNIKQT